MAKKKESTTEIIPILDSPQIVPQIKEVLQVQLIHYMRFNKTMYTSIDTKVGQLTLTDLGVEVVTEEQKMLVPFSNICFIAYK